MKVWVASDDGASGQTSTISTIGYGQLQYARDCTFIDDGPVTRTFVRWEETGVQLYEINGTRASRFIYLKGRSGIGVLRTVWQNNGSVDLSQCPSCQYPLH